VEGRESKREGKLEIEPKGRWQRAKGEGRKAEREREREGERERGREGDSKRTNGSRRAHASEISTKKLNKTIDRYIYQLASKTINQLLSRFGEKSELTLSRTNRLDLNTKTSAIKKYEQNTNRSQYNQAKSELRPE